MKEKWAILLYGLGISGGAKVIFTHALFAYSKGIDITFVTIEKKGYEESSWHKGTDKFRYITIDEATKELFSVAIATEWKSAYDISYIKADKYIYFVQSIESRFFYNQKCLLKYVADNTYDMPLTYITEATWIKDYLRQYYDKDAFLVLNGIDKNLFSLAGSCIEQRPQNHIRVVVEGAISNWLKNVPKTIELCKKAGIDDIWLVTPEKIDDYPGVNKVFSQVPYEQMPEIYRSCDVIVKLSLVEGMFGPPLEMFHCGGTAITYAISGAEEYLINNYNSIVIPINDEDGVCKALTSLIQDQNKMNRLKEAAIETASNWNDWKKSSELFFNFINEVPTISEMERKAIVKKGNSGAQMYRHVENLLGMEPYKNRFMELNIIYKKTHNKVYLYGAGAMCKSSILNLSQYDIPIEGIVVSDINSNPTTVMGHRVISINELQKEEKIIYITSEKYYSEIFQELKNRGIHFVI